MITSRVRDSWLREDFIVFGDGSIRHLHSAVARDASDEALNYALLIRHVVGMDISIGGKLSFSEKMIEDD